MFGRATITLGIGPHSSLLLFRHTANRLLYSVTEVVSKTVEWIVVSVLRVGLATCAAISPRVWALHCRCLMICRHYDSQSKHKLTTVFVAPCRPRDCNNSPVHFQAECCTRWPSLDLVFTACSEPHKVPFLVLSVTSLCMKYLCNRWMSLCKIHREDVCGP